MKKLLLTTTALFALAAPAHAAVTDSFCGPQNGQGCEISGEQKVFLQALTDTQHGLGNIGSQNGLPVMHIDTEGGLLDVFVDLKNGFSTIKPNNGISFNGLDFSIPGYTFTDLLWHAQLTPTDSHLDLFIALGFIGNHVDVGDHNYSFKADSDEEYAIHAIGGAFDEVDIRSLTGFDEVKQIEVFGLRPNIVGAPEPSTWAMGIIGFAMLGAVGWRKRTARYAIA